MSADSGNTAALAQPERVRPEGNSRIQDGLSNWSRMAGEDFSEFGEVFVHTEETLLGAAPNKITNGVFIQRTAGSLPFSAQRGLYEAISQLTLGWGTFGCQITLERLARIAGIRNHKTLRKWLRDLCKRELIRYIPVHGDLRGPIILLTLPEHIRFSIERSWVGPK